jgi:hypothetical protein
LYYLTSRTLGSSFCTHTGFETGPVHFITCTTSFNLNLYSTCNYAVFSTGFDSSILTPSLYSGVISSVVWPSVIFSAF